MAALVRRVIASTAIAAVMVLSVASCETNLAEGPVAIRRSGEHLEVTVCANVRVVKLIGEYKDGLWSTAGGTFVQGSGVSEIRSGARWVSTHNWPGLKLSVNRDPHVNPGASLSLYFQPTNANRAFSAAFQIGSKGLSSTAWLHPDGSLSSNPCEGVSD